MRTRSGSPFCTCRLLFACASLVMSGCEAATVANRTINQSSYIPDLQYRQVIDNLAIIADNPSAMPYFNPPNVSRTTIQRTAQTTFGSQWGLIAALMHVRNFGLGLNPVLAVTKTQEPLVLTQLAPGVQGFQQAIEEWDTALFLDPVRAIVMQGLYRKVLGYPLSTPFQTRLLQKFFYDYPNENFYDNTILFPDGLTPTYLLVGEVDDRQKALKVQVDAAVKPPVYGPVALFTPVPVALPAPGAPANGVPMAVPLPSIPHPLPYGATTEIGPELLDVFRRDEAAIMARLAKVPLYDPDHECTRRDALCLGEKVLHCAASNDFRDAVNRVSVAIATLSQRVQLERPIRERCDTYANYNAEFRELYHSLQAGWVGRGTWKDVPKDACYVAHHGKTYVWVTPDHLEQLTNLTMAILDTASVNTSSTPLISSPFTGGPPNLGPAAASAPKPPGSGYFGPTDTDTSVLPLSPAPAGRGRMVPPAPGGQSVYPAPP